VINGSNFLDFCVIPGADTCKWAGDRAGTEVIALHEQGALDSLSKVRAIFPTGRPLGWVIPDTVMVGSKKKSRNERYCGFAIIMGHATDACSYVMEQKTLTINLQIAHFGRNLSYISGAALPPIPPDLQGGQDDEPFFDIVTRKWRPAAEKPECSLARAVKHFSH
tara:strand:- start:96 stop:590 length:495 start_codon:yes stop_codon:yes gene_type:complete